MSTVFLKDFPKEAATQKFFDAAKLNPGANDLEFSFIEALIYELRQEDPKAFLKSPTHVEAYLDRLPSEKKDAIWARAEETFKIAKFMEHPNVDVHRYGKRESQTVSMDTVLDVYRTDPHLSLTKLQSRVTMEAQQNICRQVLAKEKEFFPFSRVERNVGMATSVAVVGGPVIGAGLNFLLLKLGLMASMSVSFIMLGGIAIFLSAVGAVSVIAVNAAKDPKKDAEYILRGDWESVTGESRSRAICFTGDTYLQTVDGGLITFNEMVAKQHRGMSLPELTSFDERTHTVIYQRPTRVIKHLGIHSALMYLNVKKNEASLKVTPTHRMLIVRDGAQIWEPVKKIKTGDRLVNPNNDVPDHVFEKMTIEEKSALDVYNLSFSSETTGMRPNYLVSPDGHSWFVAHNFY